MAECCRHHCGRGAGWLQQRRASGLSR